MSPNVDTAATRYDRAFYEIRRAGSARSASVMLAVLFEWMRPASVVDIGCGEGHWLAAAKRLGAREILGLDGDYVDRESLVIPSECFRALDVAKPLEVDRSFELAICMEVAEHLEASDAPRFIASLTQL